MKKDMWYEVKATFENGTTRRYEVKGMMEAIKMVDRLNTTSNVCTCKNKIVDVKVNKVA